MAETAPRLIYGEEAADLSVLEGRRIAVLGYGNQGRAQALNMRDSGLSGIIVGSVRDASWERAAADGFSPLPIADAVAGADIVFLLLPDEVAPEVFPRDVKPNLGAGDALVLASGYNLAFGGIEAPPAVDVLLLAPRMIGEKMRELYQAGDGFYSFVSVERDGSGRAWPTLLALAGAIGSLRKGAMVLSAREEAVLDLYMEQGFGALLGRILFSTLQVGMEAGLPAEALVLELYLSGEMAQTFQAMAELGLTAQASLHSLTSQYGSLMQTLSLDGSPFQSHLQQALDGVASGRFAAEWSAERAAGYPEFKRARELAQKANPFTEIENKLRAAMDGGRDP
jgi:ketol-acid reductoisomerase